MEFLQSVKWILELGVEKKCGCEFTFTLLAGVCIANTRFQVKCTWRTGQAQSCAGELCIPGLLQRVALSSVHRVRILHPELGHQN